MPQPSSPITNPNPKFDPDMHCGAKTRTGSECLHEAGYLTDHPGEGRCKYHGGITVLLKHGRKSKVEKYRGLKFSERVAEAMTDPRLMDMTRELAHLRIIVMDKLERYSAGRDAIEEIMDSVLENDEPSIVDADDLYDQLERTLPDVDIGMIKDISKIIKEMHDMQYARRYTIPIAELAKVVEQIYGGFTRIADKYDIPHEAKIEFAKELQNLRMSRESDIALPEPSSMNSMNGGR